MFATGDGRSNPTGIRPDPADFYDSLLAEIPEIFVS
jgi:hypothetical protein